MLTTEKPRRVARTRVEDIAERLRQAQGLHHDAFVKAIQRPKSEWHNIRAGRRPPPASFVRALRGYAETVGEGWPERIEAAVIQDALARVK